MISIELAKKRRKEIENINIIETEKEFKEEIYYINKQFEYLFEFIINFYEYNNIKADNNTEFFLLYNLFSDSLKKIELILNLIKKGFYSESSPIIRKIMENSIQIIYLSKFPHFDDWLEQQKFELNKFLDEKDKVNNFKNPKTNFMNGKFKELLENIDYESHYKLFQKLSQYSHTSYETLKSNSELDNNKPQIHYITNRYDKEKCEFFLNIIFGLINDSFYKGLINKFSFKDKVELPSNLKEYNKIQKKVSKVFNLWYVDNEI